MILGYVDKADRLYDLGFGTLKMKMRVESAGGTKTIVFSKASGEGETPYRVLGEADASVSVAMDHDGHPVPLLRPVEGHVYRHEAGVLFVAAPKKRDPEEPGFFLVKVRAMPSAIKFFFEDQEGTELVSIPRDEVLRIVPGTHAATVYVTAENVALPKEKIAYAAEFAPAARVAPLFADLPLSR